MRHRFGLPLLVIPFLLGALLFSVPTSAQNRALPFTPTFGSTVTGSFSTTSVNVALPASTLSDPDLFVYNSGTALAFCRWNQGAQTATTADAPIPPGTAQVFGKGNQTNNVACITASGTTVIYFATGSGF
jgi:hypothetical protein